jgi:sodium-dependent dicarboxylate transporter 2/3/5
MTALLGPSLCVMAGIEEGREIFRHFGNPIVFVFLGGFFIARGMAVNGLDRLLAVRIIQIPLVGRSPERIRFAIGGVAILLSMWISNTATAAILLPIVLGIAGSLENVFAAAEGPEAVKAKKFIPGLMLMTAYSCSIGGLATPVGSPPNLIGLGMIENVMHRSISFFDWMVVGVPISIGMFIVLSLLIRWSYPAPKVSMDGLSEVLAKLEKEIPPWGKAQWVTLVSFGTAVVLWVGPGLVRLVFGPEHPLAGILRVRLQEGTVALVAASLLFLIPVSWKPLRGAVDWQQAKHVDWGTIMLFGGGLSLGSLMHSTGLSELLARTVLGGEGAGRLWLITAIAVILATYVTELASNTASASMLVPVVMAVAASAGVSGLPPVLGVSIACNLAFMLPVSTPPNAILYGTGQIKVLQMVRTGFLLDIFGIIVVLSFLRLLLPLVGY